MFFIWLWEITQIKFLVNWLMRTASFKNEIWKPVCGREANLVSLLEFGFPLSCKTQLTFWLPISNHPLLPARNSSEDCRMGGPDTWLFHLRYWLGTGLPLRLEFTEKNVCPSAYKYPKYPVFGVLKTQKRKLD